MILWSDVLNVYTCIFFIYVVRVVHVRVLSKGSVYKEGGSQGKAPAPLSNAAINIFFLIFFVRFFFFFVRVVQASVLSEGSGGKEGDSHGKAPAPLSNAAGAHLSKETC